MIATHFKLHNSQCLLALIIFSVCSICATNCFAEDYQLGYSTNGYVHLNYKTTDKTQIGLIYNSISDYYGYSQRWGISGKWLPFSKVNENGMYLQIDHLRGSKGIRSGSTTTTNYSSSVSNFSLGYEYNFQISTLCFSTSTAVMIPTNEELVEISSGIYSQRTFVWPSFIFSFRF